MSKDKTGVSGGSPLYDGLKAAVRPFVRALLDHGHPAVSGPIEKDVCSFVETIEYAIDVRTKHPQVSALLVKRDRRTDGRWDVTQAFVDTSDQLVRNDRGIIGRQLIVTSFDDELTDLIGTDGSVVIGLPAQSTT